MENKSLDFPVVIPLMSVYKINMKIITSEISRVLRSSQAFLLDQSFKVTIKRVKMETGGTGKKKKNSRFCNN